MTSGTRNTANRYLDATAANLIAVQDKVLRILKGEIPDPEVVELFITNYCSFACPYCRCAKYHGNRSEFLDFTVLARLLDDLTKRGVKTIELGGGGEPLEHPVITDIFERFVKNEFRVGLITNGYVLIGREDLTDLLLGCADWVRFSLDAIANDTFRIVHGRHDLSYEELSQTISCLVARVRAKPDLEQRPKIGIKLIVQKPNEHQILDAVDEALRLGVHYLQFKWLEGHPWSLDPERRKPLVDRLEERVAALPAGSLTVDLLPGYGGPKAEGRCVMSVLHPLIDWDGTIYVCAFFHHRKISHSIGSLAAKGFFDLWGSEHHREQIDGVDPYQCVPNCPLLRYNPVIDFIREESFRFRYI